MNPPQVLKRRTVTDDESPAEAPEALLAVLACAHSFVSSATGVEAALRAGGALVQPLCAALRWRDADASRMALEILCNLCVYSAIGYCTALQVRPAQQGPRP